jgi:hypothetical protein
MNRGVILFALLGAAFASRAGVPAFPGAEGFGTCVSVQGGVARVGGRTVTFDGRRLTVN